MKNYTAVALMSAMLLSTVALTGCTIQPNVRALAIADAATLLESVGPEFEIVLSESTEPRVAVRAILDGKTGFGSSLAHANTPEEVHDSGFNSRGIALYAAKYDGKLIQANLLLAGLGKTRDWAQQIHEVAYTCLSVSGVFPDTHEFQLSEQECPADLLAVAFVGIAHEPVGLREIQGE